MRLNIPSKKASVADKLQSSETPLVQSAEDAEKLISDIVNKHSNPNTGINPHQAKKRRTAETPKEAKRIFQELILEPVETYYPTAQVDSQLGNSLFDAAHASLQIQKTGLSGASEVVAIDPKWILIAYDLDDADRLKREQSGSLVRYVAEGGTVAFLRLCPSLFGEVYGTCMISKNKKVEVNFVECGRGDETQLVAEFRDVLSRAVASQESGVLFDLHASKF